MNEKSVHFVGYYYKCISNSTFQKTYNSLCLSIRLFVCTSLWINSAPNGRIFMKFLFEYVSKNCQEISIFIKIWNGWVLCRNTSMHLWSYISQFFLEWKFLSDKTCRDNCNTHFTFSKGFFPRKLCHSQDNVKNIVESDRSARMTIWRMRIAC